MLHIVTVATESRYYLPYLYDTCERFGYTLNVLGFNEKWSGYVFKLEKMIEFLRNVDPQDIVCFVDGYDVICTRNLNELVPIFLDIQEKTGCKIVISEDTGCIPKFISSVYFGTCSNTFINSGAYIGMAGDILGILLEIRDLYPKETDDQRMMTQYCTLFPAKFYIDTHCYIFQSHVYPLTQARLHGNPFFVHAAGCGYLDDILVNMGYDVNPEIRTELRQYFFRKSGEHVSVFLQRYIIWILIIAVVIILVSF